MQVWRGSAPAGWGRSVITIGVFDGVHRGHRSVISHAVAHAREHGLKAVVVTFDPHPAEVVRPGSHPAILTSLTRKAELIEALDVDALCVLPFTPEFSRLSPEAFVHDVLVEGLQAAMIVVGDNFRFGHKAAGDVALLTALGRAVGFAVADAPLIGAGPGDGAVVSSTSIRACVAAGEVAAASAALGRPHRIEGIVVRGDQRGKQLGFPTANIASPLYTAIPSDGVYAGRVVRDKDTHVAAISIGTNPTFAGAERRVEAFLLDFDSDLYGERVAVEFTRHLREMRRYDTVEALVTQIHQDVAATRAAFGP